MPKSVPAASRNKSFKGLTIGVGGKSFVSCRFESCELVFDGEPVVLEQNDFINCRWRFEGAAATTIAVLKALCGSDPAFAKHLASELGVASRPLH